MKITVTKIQRELEKNKRWDKDYLEFTYAKDLIKDTLKIVDEILRANKNITILGKKK